MRRLVLLPLLALAACGSPASSTPATPSPPSSGAPTAEAAQLPVRPGVGLVERDGTARGERVGACRAQAPKVAQLQMVLEEPMTGLEVEAVGQDLTLEVHQGRSHWCGKTETGGPRVARGAWSKGTYEVFVGTVEAGAERPFKLRVLEPGL